MIDHKSIIKQVIERKKKTFIQTSLDFNKVSNDKPVEVILSTSERLALQKQVKLSSINLASLECVKSTLPYLLPSQQEDVVKAERWLYKMNNKAILFTNVVGSGKSLLGGGIMFRHYGNILLVVPSNQKCLDWQEELKCLSLKSHILESIKDKGNKGINITTYANFRQNTKIQQRDWDMVFYDECHYIMSNEQGKETNCLQTHRKTTNHATFIREKSQVNVCGEKPKTEGDILKYNQLLKLKSDEINAEIKRLENFTKVVFLSATPFPYIENLEYADGYLFEMGDDKRVEGLPSEKDLFYMDNFGYSFEKGRLVRPETGVDVSALEREFADKLLSSGAMSTRTIELNMDYSREFILV